MSTGAKTPIEIFLSYSHRDEALKDELAVHLTSLSRERLVSVWHDRRIGLGEDWRGAIDAHLEKAGIILLLVSPDFMASDYCHDVEASRAMERLARGQALVIPILLRPTDWSHAPFARLQALPRNMVPVKSWRDRDEAWLDVVTGLRAAIGKLAARSPEARRTLRGAVAAARGNAGLPMKPSALPSATRPVSAPTRASIRQLLGAVLRTDSDFDAFCLDHFEATYARFSAGMDRVAKASLLLSTQDLDAILACLREHAPDAVAKHWDT